MDFAALRGEAGKEEAEMPKRKYKSRLLIVSCKEALPKSILLRLLIKVERVGLRGIHDQMAPKRFGKKNDEA